MLKLKARADCQLTQYELVDVTDFFSPSHARLNIIRRLVADDADFLHHVTQLDLRDNKLGDLDATVFNNVEILHCERNQLMSLKISGYLLKALYASSNGTFFLTELVQKLLLFVFI